MPATVDPSLLSRDAMPVPVHVSAAPWALGGVLAIVALAASCQVVGLRPSVLLGGGAIAAGWRLVAAAYPPELSLTFVSTALSAVLDTLAVAVGSTLLSIAIGLPLAALATPLFWAALSTPDGEDAAGRAYRFTVAPIRSLLAAIRAVPDVLWALLFVAAAGLGSVAGLLALTVTYTAALARMYADVFDDVPRGPVGALRASGASRLQVFVWSIWPQAVPGIVAYTLYSFECAVRAAPVLGFVGAGGLGQELAISLRLFRYDEALTLLLAFGLLTVGGEQFSSLVRWRLRTSPPARACAATHLRKAPASWVPTMPASALWMGAALVGAGALQVSGVGPGVVDGMFLTRIARFVASCLPPDLAPAFLASTLRPLLETVAISVLGTAGGICVAAALAIPAAATLTLRPPDSAGRDLVFLSIARALLYGGARAALGVLRAVPDLVWVMLCVIFVGFGPAAGTLAIVLHTGGVLGRLYADTLEEAPEGPMRAMRAAGARSWQALVWTAYPSVRPLLASYTMLRWESNLRACTILGLVGGGGLGEAIYQNVQLGFYPRVLTLVALVALLVLTADRLSERLRVRLQRA